MINVARISDPCHELGGVNVVDLSLERMHP